MAWRWFLAWLGMFAATTAVIACPFCAKMSRSFADDLRESEVVLFGDIIRRDGVSLLIVRSVIRAGVPENVPSELTLASKTLAEGEDRIVFGHGEPGGLSPTRVDRSNIARASYLGEVNRGLRKAQVERLAFFFDHLDHADSVIAGDAYAEFAKASYRSTRSASASFDEERIRRWLKDERTPAERIGLFGLLLGLCGQKDDADLLTEMLNTPTPTQRVGMDGMLGGLYHLSPGIARDRITRWLTEAESSSIQRMSALSALQFIMLESPPSDAKDWLLALSPGLKHADSAAPLVDEMRRGNCWEAADDVLSAVPSLLGEVRSENSHATRALEPAVVRFALQCPRPKCQRLIERVNQRNLQLVQEARQAIEFEENARRLLLSNPAER